MQDVQKTTTTPHQDLKISSTDAITHRDSITKPASKTNSFEVELRNSTRKVEPEGVLRKTIIKEEEKPVVVSSVSLRGSQTNLRKSDLIPIQKANTTSALRNSKNVQANDNGVRMSTMEEIISRSLEGVDFEDEEEEGETDEEDEDSFEFVAENENQ